MIMRTAVAGTFDILHDGHRALLKRAFEVGDTVAIGITSDEMAAKGRKVVLPLELRISALKAFLAGMLKPWEIFIIDDIYGPKGTMDSAHILVLTEETLPNGRKINEDRRFRGVPPLEFSVVPLVMAYDGDKISSSAILEGKYGKNGADDVLDVAVGTMNPVKIEAVRYILEKIYGNVRITAVDVESGVPEQPFESDVRKGAVNRASKALGNHSMAFGIEAGVFERIDGLYDIQYCAIIDKCGNLTVGMGPGFAYPDDVADLVRNGYTVSGAISELYGNEGIGKRQGAIGLLSNGLLDRKTLTEQAVIAAMVPRIASHLGY